jgi:hypothetical protein
MTLASGIADGWGDVAPYVTLEGVNTVMFQQCTRKLIKEITNTQKGKKSGGYFDYINHLDDLCSTKMSDDPNCFSDLSYLEKVMSINAAA